MGTTGGAVHAPTGAGGSNAAPNVRAIDERVELDRKVVEEPLWRFIEDMLKENHPSTNHDGLVWFDGLVWMCLVRLENMGSLITSLHGWVTFCVRVVVCIVFAFFCFNCFVVMFYSYISRPMYWYMLEKYYAWYYYHELD